MRLQDDTYAGPPPQKKIEWPRTSSYIQTCKLFAVSSKRYTACIQAGGEGNPFSHLDDNCRALPARGIPQLGKKILLSDQR